MISSAPSYVVTAPQLNYQKLFASSANDAWSLMLRRRTLVVSILVMVAVFTGIAVLTGGAKPHLNQLGSPEIAPMIAETIAETISASAS